MLKRFFLFVAVVWTVLLTALLMVMAVTGDEGAGFFFLIFGGGLALWAGLYWVVVGGR